MEIKKEKLEARLPMCFSQVKITNEKSAQEAIANNHGKVVLLKDAHISGQEIEYHVGRIDTIDKDNECYNFTRLHQKRTNILHYDDLEGLMVPGGIPSVKIHIYPNS